MAQLSKKIFFQQMQLINSSTYGNMYENQREVDSLYFLFQDYPDSVFIKGIETLIKSEDSPYPPSVGKIIKYLDKVVFFGMDKEEFLSVLRVYKATGGMPYSIETLNAVLEKIDIDKSIGSIYKNKGVIYKENIKEVKQLERT